MLIGYRISLHDIKRDCIETSKCRYSDGRNAMSQHSAISLVVDRRNEPASQSISHMLKNYVCRLYCTVKIEQVGDDFWHCKNHFTAIITSTVHS